VQAQDFHVLLFQIPCNASPWVGFWSITAIVHLLSGFSGSELLFRKTFQCHCLIIEKHAIKDAECKLMESSFKPYCEKNELNLGCEMISCCYFQHIHQEPLCVVKCYKTDKKNTLYCEKQTFLCVSCFLSFIAKLQFVLNIGCSDQICISRKLGK